MATIRVRVMAVADASMAKVFAPLQASAAKARATVAGEMGKVASDAKRSGDSIYRTAAHQEEETTSLVRREADKQARERERSLKYVAGVRDRYFADQQRQEERATREASRQADKRAKSYVEGVKEFGGKVASNLGSAARLGMGVAGTFAHGAGVNTDIGSNINAGVHLQSSITDTVNSAAGAQGRSGTKEEVEATTKAVKEAANATSQDYLKMADGLQMFVQRSSDLKTGTAILKDMGKIAQATGTDITEILTAAGPIAKKFEGQADEAERVSEAMRLIAKQGAMGNVEIREMAPFMSRLVASVGKFTGKGVSRDQALGQLGAVAQISMQGGASNAGEASQAAATFARDLAKKQTEKQFAAIMGRDYSVFTDKSKTQMKLPEEIIMDVLKKTGGNQEQIQALFRNTSSAKGVLGAANIYKDAGGGAAGETAVKDIFKNLSQTLSPEEVDKASALKGDTTEAKAQLVNNKLQDLAAKLSEKMLPALEKLEPSLEKLAPTAERLADALASMTAYAVDNPIKAGAIALGASIAKAGVEMAIAKAGEAILEKAATSLAGNLSSLSTHAGDAAKGTGLLAAAIAGFMAGKSWANSIADARDKAETDYVGKQMGIGNVESASKTAIFQSQADKDKAIADAKATQADLQSRIANASKIDFTSGTLGGDSASAALNWVSGGSVGRSMNASESVEKDRANIGELKAELARMSAAINKLGDRPVKVTVNMPNGSPTVDPAARSGT